MRKGLLSLFFFFVALLGYAQIPQAFDFQGVARDASGNVLSTQAIVLRISVLQGSAVGPISYQETHSVFTSPLGLFNIAVGGGSPMVGVFGDISWGSASHYIRVELDAYSTGIFLTVGTQQLLSVPYALYAASGTPGPEGPAGPMGPEGPPVATSGITATAYGSDPAAGSNPNDVKFFGAVAPATITAGQRVFVASSRAMGSTEVGGAAGLDLWMCYQSNVPGSTPVPVGGGTLGLRVPQNTRVLFPLSAVFSSLPAGGYVFGLCGYCNAANAGKWNSNEFGYTSLFVF